MATNNSLNITNLAAAGGSGSALVDFGLLAGGEDFNKSVVVSASWVKANSKIFCQVSAETTADHDPDDIIVESLSAYASDIIPDTSFVLHISAPNGTFGKYTVFYFGV